MAVDIMSSSITQSEKSQRINQLLNHINCAHLQVANEDWSEIFANIQCVCGSMGIKKDEAISFNSASKRTHYSKLRQQTSSVAVKCFECDKLCRAISRRVKPDSGAHIASTLIRCWLIPFRVLFCARYLASLTISPSVALWYTKSTKLFGRKNNNYAISTPGTQYA